MKNSAKKRHSNYSFMIKKHLPPNIEKLRKLAERVDGKGIDSVRSSIFVGSDSESEDQDQLDELLRKAKLQREEERKKEEKKEKQRQDKIKKGEIWNVKTPRDRRSSV